MLDLNSHLDGSGTGWTLSAASGINDAGQIVGYGTHDGVIRAFLLTPTPPPPLPKLFGLFVGSTDVSSSGPLHITVDGQGDAQAMDAALHRFSSFAGSQTELFLHPDD